MILPCDVSNVLLWALMRVPTAAAGPVPRACLGASPAHPAPGADLLAACPPQLLSLHCGAWLLDDRFLLKAFAHFMGTFERFSTCVVILWVFLRFYSSGHVMGLSARFFRPAGLAPLELARLHPLAAASRTRGKCPQSVRGSPPARQVPHAFRNDYRTHCPGTSVL